MTKRLLKDALIELLKDKTIYKISIRELCEAANINRTTFYKYYGSQFDLLAEIENDLLTLINETIIRHSEQGVQIICEACHYLEDNLELARVLINNNVDPQFPEKLFNLPLVKQETLKNIGERYSKEEFEYYYNFITYGCYQIIRLWINKDNRESPEEFARLIIHFFQG